LTGIGHLATQIGDANKDYSIAYSDGMIDTDVRVKTNVDVPNFGRFVEKCEDLFVKTLDL
jgi:hypothetical protein